jgi:hypothetical protein
VYREKQFDTASVTSDPSILPLHCQCNPAPDEPRCHCAHTCTLLHVCHLTQATHYGSFHSLGAWPSLGRGAKAKAYGQVACREMAWLMWAKDPGFFKGGQSRTQVWSTSTDVPPAHGWHL